jgi:glutamate 5-kinase
MTDLLRQEIAATADLMVVKVGTRVLTHRGGTLNEERVAQLAEEIHWLWESGRKVVLVSSGAVGAGMGRLGLDARPKDLARLQAVAAIGQSKLIEAYDRALASRGRHAAQVLLTADDLNHRTRYLNVRNTLLALLECGAVPVINENDTVAVDELQTTFGDNDRLAALVTNLLRAPLLVLLSDVEGLYDAPPPEGDRGADDARVIPTVRQIDESIVALVKDRVTGLSKGGMASKLAAARMCTAAGENVIIASGRRPGVLKQIVGGEQVGTLFLAVGQSISSRKRWIAFTVPPRGQLSLDHGASRAIGQQGRSLLAIGIVDVQGQFAKGDVVAMLDGEGREIARGLSNYSADEVRRIQGLRSEQIATVLGHRPYEEVVHRDNMAITAR